MNAVEGLNWAERPGKRSGDADQPSKIIVGDSDGIILDVHLFGQDLSDEYDHSGSLNSEK